MPNADENEMFANNLQQICSGAVEKCRKIAPLQILESDFRKRRCSDILKQNRNEPKVYVVSIISNTGSCDVPLNCTSLSSNDGVTSVINVRPVIVFV